MRAIYPRLFQGLTPEVAAQALRGEIGSQEDLADRILVARMAAAYRIIRSTEERPPSYFQKVLQALGEVQQRRMFKYGTTLAQEEARLTLLWEAAHPEVAFEMVSIKILMHTLTAGVLLDEQLVLSSPPSTPRTEPEVDLQAPSVTWPKYVAAAGAVALVVAGTTIARRASRRKKGRTKPFLRSSAQY